MEFPIHPIVVAQIHYFLGIVDVDDVHEARNVESLQGKNLPQGSQEDR
jgi:hypothetical protein